MEVAMSFSKSRLKIFPATLVALAAVILASPAVGRPQYRVTGAVALPGEGGWDDMTFDAAGHRLFIAHATRVEVVDTDRLSRVGEIADTPGGHGLPLAPAPGP